MESNSTSLATLLLELAIHQICFSTFLYCWQCESARKWITSTNKPKIVLGSINIVNWEPMKSEVSLSPPVIYKENVFWDDVIVLYSLNGTISTKTLSCIANKFSISATVIQLSPKNWIHHPTGYETSQERLLYSTIIDRDSFLTYILYHLPADPQC